MTNTPVSGASAVDGRTIDSVRLTLKVLFGLVPIAAGADKFMNLLTNWEHYLSPWVTDLLPLSPSAFMHLVGVIEIIAGILVFFKTRLGAGIVTLWLLLIALQLLLMGQHYDVAVRDIVLALGGSWTLFRLTPAE